MNAHAYEMKMPAAYVELSADEVEYEGGINPFVGFLVSVGLAAVSNVLLGTDNKYLQALGAGLGAASICVGLFTGATALTTAVTGITRLGIAASTATRVANAGAAVYGLGIRPVSGSYMMANGGALNVAKNFFFD